MSPTDNWKTLKNLIPYFFISIFHYVYDLFGLNIGWGYVSEFNGTKFISWIGKEKRVENLCLKIKKWWLFRK